MPGIQKEPNKHQLLSSSLSAAPAPLQTLIQLLQGKVVYTSSSCCLRTSFSNLHLIHSHLFFMSLLSSHFSMSLLNLCVIQAPCDSLSSQNLPSFYGPATIYSSVFTHVVTGASEWCRLGVFPLYSLHHSQCPASAWCSTLQSVCSERLGAQTLPSQYQPSSCLVLKCLSLWFFSCSLSFI